MPILKESVALVVLICGLLSYVRSVGPVRSGSVLSLVAYQYHCLMRTAQMLTMREG